MPALLLVAQTGAATVDFDTLPSAITGILQEYLEVSTGVRAFIKDLTTSGVKVPRIKLRSPMGDAKRLRILIWELKLAGSRRTFYNSLPKRQRTFDVWCDDTDELISSRRGYRNGDDGYYSEDDVPGTCGYNCRGYTCNSCNPVVTRTGITIPRSLRWLPGYVMYQIIQTAT